MSTLPPPSAESAPPLRASSGVFADTEPTALTRVWTRGGAAGPRRGAGAQRRAAGPDRRPREQPQEPTPEASTSGSEEVRLLSLRLRRPGSGLLAGAGSCALCRRGRQCRTSPSAALVRGGEKDTAQARALTTRAKAGLGVRAERPLHGILWEPSARVLQDPELADRFVEARRLREQAAGVRQPAARRGTLQGAPKRPRSRRHSSLTVLEKDHLKHWFSSLQPSRNAVFSIIEHFWRELLLSPSEAPLPVTKGKQLTGLMACSQKRLEETARVLHHQGEQLDSITKGLDKMESDLDLADRLLTELESPSWWPFSSKLWKMPAETKSKGGTSTASPKALGKEGVVVRIPAVISQGTASHVKAGSLTILVSGLKIHDSSSLLMHRFEREDIDDIKVHTPFEISILQRFIGKPDIAYHLISAKMPEAVPILEVQFSKKMELLEGGLTPGSASTSSPAEKGCYVWKHRRRPARRQPTQRPTSPTQARPSRAPPALPPGTALASPYPGGVLQASGRAALLRVLVRLPSSCEDANGAGSGVAGPALGSTVFRPRAGEARIAGFIPRCGGEGSPA
ncbi:synaptosomal-associated protein 47-like [Zalophus californianus]|uniref:Synaptosomal-associated protein 47-like n=1 Tax=Zalophus californianus TaxID=9704 RepID=A0A6P9EZJ4_ZALCA|nr:synaptosomal-associated protein 47-like [Zalophus californianus]